jgi:non-specific protein-tyrosine kinase
VASIPAVVEWRDRAKPELVSVTAPRSSAAEAYRSLRTSVQFAGLENEVNVIAITSPSAGEGKTTAVANLAVVAAGAGRRVVLLDCDLRRPRIHTFFGMSNEVGFTSWIVGDAPLSAALQEVPGVRRLSLMASGPIPHNPSELLSSRRFPELVRTLQADGALVIIDTPPLLPVTDAAVIARSIDIVFVVTMAGKGTRRQLRHAIEILDRVEAPIGGLVLNGVGDTSAYYYQGSYYGEPSSELPPSQRRHSPRGGRSRPPSLDRPGQSRSNGQAHSDKPRARKD